MAIKIVRHAILQLPIEPQQKKKSRDIRSLGPKSQIRSAIFRKFITLYFCDILQYKTKFGRFLPPQVDENHNLVEKYCDDSVHVSCMVGQSYKLRFTLEQAMKDQKRNVINSPFLRPWVVNATPRPLYPQKTPGTHCTGSRAGTRAGKHACGKPGVHWDSIPGSSNAQRVAVSTEISRPVDSALIVTKILEVPPSLR